jgi:hypothetical protein
VLIARILDDSELIFSMKIHSNVIYSRASFDRSTRTIQEDLALVATVDHSTEHPCGVSHDRASQDDIVVGDRDSAGIGRELLACVSVGTMEGTLTTRHGDLLEETLEAMEIFGRGIAHDAERAMGHPACELVLCIVPTQVTTCT